MTLTREGLENRVQSIIRNINYPYSREYVHLHVHSEFSLLDGASKVADLIDKCIEVNTPLVITDHGNVACTVRGHKLSKEKGVPFIRGCEVYIKKSNGDDEEDYESGYYHLILLPYTEEGFENINYLSSMGFVQGKKVIANRVIPVIDKKWLKENSKGIVALSACMFGEVSANVWINYPYLELLSIINPKYKTQAIRIARNEIDERNVLTKKSGLTSDDLSDNEVMALVLKKKKLKKLKKFILNKVKEASNEDIILAAKNEEGYIDDIKDLIKGYVDIFDFFYLEIQDHNFVEQKITTLIQKHIVESEDIGTKLVVTNDVHYVNKDDWKMQDTLLCLATKKMINDKDRFRFNEHELYFKTPNEIKEKFNYITEEEKLQYMKNSTEITHICLNYEIDFSKKYYPEFDIPKEFKNVDEYLLYLCKEGARELSEEMGDRFRYKILNYIPYEELRNEVFNGIEFDRALEMVKDVKRQAEIMPMVEASIHIIVNKLMKKIEYVNTLTKEERKRYEDGLYRIIYEFAIIVIKGIPDYFLITKKIINGATDEDILVGPGRGSAAGSAVAYLLGIVQIDPLDYSLYFERERCCVQTYRLVACL